MKNVIIAIVTLSIFSMLSVGSASAQMYRLAPQQQFNFRQRVVPTPPETMDTYANVTNLNAFSAETEYMSLPGYLRYLTHQRTSQWLAYPEATRIVRQ
ncbi:MAG TPA: hypothetical protein VKV57_13795 [bacterium]|nr:hypothetical protein [bacterium]